MENIDLRFLRDLMLQSKEPDYQKIADFFNQSPQLQFAGMFTQLIKPGEATIAIPKVMPIHQGGLGCNAVNGGIIAMICDLTLGLLGVDFWKHGFTATQNLSINYLRPLLASSVFAQGKVEKVVGKKVMGLIEVSNEQGEICSCAHGILATGLQEK